MISTFQRFRIDGKTNTRWCKFCKNKRRELTYNSVSDRCDSEKVAEHISATIIVPLLLTAEIEMYVYEHGCSGFEMSISRLVKEV
jgi:lipoate synthase